MGVAADDEPLDGDIGPAADPGGPRAAGTSGPPEADARADARADTEADARADAAAELRRYEAEREERRRSTNALAGRIAAVLAALLLAFLAYDSARTALTARSRGDNWIYPPLVIAGICTIALVTLVAWAVRRVK
ncbi:hypothetical protein E1200_33445 [Actinomadura sp. GC306]|uniref:hypothetical protein n=1 Tax=Actinomadura sp. GC306 TaxID=2530367 RepID=UPI00104F724B|nr:hypothetical protein [Actinomadura sp. GC306]TDC57411.1 hypothetical protein E1200_33445 [Actinomadura sp. GC306]